MWTKVLGAEIRWHIWFTIKWGEIGDKRKMIVIVLYVFCVCNWINNRQERDRAVCEKWNDEAREMISFIMRFFFFFFKMPLVWLHYNFKYKNITIIIAGLRPHGHWPWLCSSLVWEGFPLSQLRSHLFPLPMPTPPPPVKALHPTISALTVFLGQTWECEGQGSVFPCPWLCLQYPAKAE